MSLFNSQAENIPDRHDVNLFTSDTTLQALLPLYLSDALRKQLHARLQTLGALAGGRLNALAESADKNPPQLKMRSRTGSDRQSIIKHPAYSEMEQLAFGDFAMAALSHRADLPGWPGPCPPLVKYLFTYLFVQAEFGLMCPVSMTDSLARTLKKFGSPMLTQRYLPRLTSLDAATRLQGAMFMTEQDAGSDIAATTALAVPAQDHYLLYGEKWFCSNPDAGLAMVLARIEGAPGGIKGVSLFLLPRTLEGGAANAYRILRLKDKLGTRSMASGEIRLEGAQAWLVGEAGRGFVQMADMINNSRLSNGVRSAGLMQRAVSEAFYIARQRRAFGKTLIEQPLMRRQLLKILLPCEQARSMVLQSAEILRRADGGDKQAYALLRILTPLIKFRACRDARKVTADAMEVRGGCGYIEEWGDPRLFRDAQLGSIWEGTSNIVALDVRRAILREQSLEALAPWLAHYLSEAKLGSELQQQFAAAQEQVWALAAASAQPEGTALARAAASGLYHFISAVIMAWESQQAGLPARRQLAQLILIHKLLPHNPLGRDAAMAPEVEAQLLADVGDAGREQ
ncbi:acyl-CoA dehydrogenase family protein [Erwinia aphidicola]|jgi:alkylation response protein AidB-like acyl-CoA dehydrogenase|uniref:acyl-CoA dehydrogenase family protein n=1 Tax=Erwinia aphidicola TaxID=68334 RepID=UPI000671D617|nr:isovaleryl-CoA dehydrogenase [bacteria symbiont BFo1 of Frankliniella occidentalis]PIJ58396.1 DNA alkylation response protein [Erwinia sp. OLMDLW33]